jgi:hypothetical protein
MIDEINLIELLKFTYVFLFMKMSIHKTIYENYMSLLFLIIEKI